MKKMKKKKQATKNGVTKLLPQERNELSAIVNELFHKCVSKLNVTSPNNLNSAQNWEEYLQIHKLVDVIREIEKEIKLPNCNRNEQIEPFIEWLHTNNAEMEGIMIENYAEKGFGLKCTKDLNEGDIVLKVPNAIIMSEETAKKSYLGSLIEKDPILQHMGNVSVSMHVLGEMVLPDSFWLPYLRILPLEFSNTLYFTPEQTQLLKGSPAFDEIVKQYRNVARQYSYFYRLLQDLPQAKRWPIRDYFTFDSYRWAVSAVMTRLNRIPDKDSSGQLALIPAWDMANHEQGNFSTDFDEEKSLVTSFAHRDFATGDEYKIFYGERSNTEFFLHSGFVYKDNPNNNCSLKLGVSSSDPLYKEKSGLLTSLNLSVNGSFLLSAGEHPITQELLAFSRIFCMDKESLDKWSDESNMKNLLLEDCDIDTMIEDKAFKFLSIRVNLLIRCYPTTLEEDEISLAEYDGIELLVRSFLIEEKKVLKNAAAYLSSKVK